MLDYETLDSDSSVLGILINLQFFVEMGSGSTMESAQASISHFFHTFIPFLKPQSPHVKQQHQQQQQQQQQQLKNVGGHWFALGKVYLKNANCIKWCNHDSKLAEPQLFETIENVYKFLHELTQTQNASFWVVKKIK